MSPYSFHEEGKLTKAKALSKVDIYHPKSRKQQQTQLRIVAGSTLPNPASVGDLRYIQDNCSTNN